MLKTDTMPPWTAAIVIGLVLGSGMAAGQTANRAVIGGRGALVIQAGGCTVIIYSGRTRATPPDTESHGPCDIQVVARKVAGQPPR